MEKIDIIYNDGRIVAINKPSSLLVHKTKIDRHDKFSAMMLLRNQLKKWVYPLHRLDKATSGVLLFALDKDSAGVMNNLFRTQMIKKRYVAVVRGFVDNNVVVNYPLSVKNYCGQNSTDKKQQAVTNLSLINKIVVNKAVGRYDTARYSLVEAIPETGRNHQIRRHLKHLFHPIIGDSTYGDGVHNKFFRNNYKINRLLLHCRDVEFRSPFSGESISISAEFDSAFSHLFELFNWRLNY